MILIIIGLVFVLVLYSCLVVAGRADRKIEKIFEEEEEKRNNE